jgi:hypothetical protein
MCEARERARGELNKISCAHAKCCLMDRSFNLNNNSMSCFHLRTRSSHIWPFEMTIGDFWTTFASREDANVIGVCEKLWNLRK